MSVAPGDGQRVELRRNGVVLLSARVPAEIGIVLARAIIGELRYPEWREFPFEQGDSVVTFHFKNDAGDVLLCVCSSHVAFHAFERGFKKALSSLRYKMYYAKKAEDFSTYLELRMRFQYLAWGMKAVGIEERWWEYV